MKNELYSAFSGLLSYPDTEKYNRAKETLDRLSEKYPEIEDDLNRFESETQKLEIEDLEEIYTKTFDMNKDCCLYIGYHIFDEGYKRNLFLSKLNSLFDGYDYETGTELPDHLSKILEFLTLDIKEKDRTTLLDEGLMPALDKLKKNINNSGGNPYKHIVNALKKILNNEVCHENN